MIRICMRWGKDIRFEQGKKGLQTPQGTMLFTMKIATKPPR